MCKPTNLLTKEETGITQYQVHNMIDSAMVQVLTTQSGKTTSTDPPGMKYKNFPK